MRRPGGQLRVELPADTRAGHQPRGAAHLGRAVWVVDPLALPPLHADFEDVLGSEAVRLFASSRAVDRSVVQSRARQCRIRRGGDPSSRGLPLALELAAAHLSVLSVAQLDAELATSLRCLNDAHAAHGRQMTMRQSMERSVALLDKPQRKILRRISVLAGVWTLDAARHVCANDEQFGLDVLPTLRELIDRSLVRAVPGSSVMRFSLTNATREYGAAASRRRRNRRYARAACRLVSWPRCRVGPRVRVYGARSGQSVSTIRTCDVAVSHARSGCG